MNTNEIITHLESLRNDYNREGMARFGINVDKAFGITVTYLRTLAKKIGKDHTLAIELWKTGYHEARILATMIDEPAKVTSAQMDKWVKDFDSWDICDGCINNLFRKTPYAIDKALKWIQSDKTFIKRAGFAMIAVLAVHDKQSEDEIFTEYLELIKEKSDDERNFVKKAVNWALRQIGKRNLYLNKEAVKTAKEILKTGTKSGKWIACDALRELQGEAIKSRISEKKYRKIL
ncbi:MAG: DNA alkylation repair protein [Ignavibacteriae bacterium]|nr:MAG: DNA alkylation repair protein [Ignavibacteriota bacterium]